MYREFGEDGLAGLGAEEQRIHGRDTQHRTGGKQGRIILDLKGYTPGSLRSKAKRDIRVFSSKELLSSCLIQVLVHTPVPSSPHHCPHGDGTQH